MAALAAARPDELDVVPDPQHRALTVAAATTGVARTDTTRSDEAGRRPARRGALTRLGAIAGVAVAACAAVVIGLTLAPGGAQQARTPAHTYWETELATYSGGKAVCGAVTWMPRSPSDQAWTSMRVSASDPMCGVGEFTPELNTRYKHPLTSYSDPSALGGLMLATGDERLTVADVMGLPTQSGRLLTVIESWMTRDAMSVVQCHWVPPGGHTVPAAETRYCHDVGIFQVATATLPYLPVSPGTRAAFVQLLKTLPVTVRNTRDPLGRRGMGIELDGSRYEKAFDGGQPALVLKPATYTVLGEDEGSDGFMVVLHQGWTTRRPPVTTPTPDR
jgi:hypothetical protein